MPHRAKGGVQKHQAEKIGGGKEKKDMSVLAKKKSKSRA